MGHKNWSFWPYLSEKLAEIGVATIRFDLSMSGIGADSDAITEEERFRAVTITQDLDDISRVLDAVGRDEIGLARYIDRHKIILLGHSRGAGLAFLTAARDNSIMGLVSIAGPDDFARFDGDVMKKWEDDGFLEFTDAATGRTLKLDYAIAADYAANREEYDILRAAGRLGMPVLLIHGEDDAEVPAVESERLAAAIPSATWTVMIPGAGHLLNSDIVFAAPSAELDLAVEATYDFILRYFF